MRLKFRLWYLSAVCAVCALFVSCAPAAQPAATAVRIAIPYEKRLSTINDDYYKQWMEEHTGLSIEFVFLPQTHTNEYLRMLFTSHDSNIDAVFFSRENAPTPQELAAYGQSGALAPLDTLLDTQGNFLPDAVAEHTAFDLQKAITAPDGHIYFMPAQEVSAVSRHLQTFWVNIAWLEALDLTLPATTDDFAAMLRTFADAYPQGTPMIGSTQSDSTNVCHFLLNSFTVCDPANSYLAMENGAVYFPPATQEWRDGLRYCRTLYEEGLLPAQHFTFTTDQLAGFVNDPRDLAGAFPAKFISDVLSVQSPQLSSRFFALPPLSGPQKSGNAIVETSLPRAGGVILSSSPHAAQVFALMDLMCSEEAFLIGHYGQENVDWVPAQASDTTATGNPATLVVTSAERLMRDSTENSVVGPFVAREKLVNGVVWKGYPVNQDDSLNARAARLYRPYELREQIPATIRCAEHTQQLQQIKSYVQMWMTDFVTGSRSLEEDAVWDEYLNGLTALELPQLVAVAQKTICETEES